MNLFLEGAKAGISELGHLVSGDDVEAPSKPPAPDQPPETATVAVAPSEAPRPKTPDEIDAELGLPPAERDLTAPPDMDADFFDVMGAAWRDETIRTDAWGDTASRRRSLAKEMEGRLPPEVRAEIWARYQDRGDWRTLEQIVVEETARMVSENPDSAGDWADMPLTLEAFNTRIDTERKADLKAAQDVLDQPSWGVAAFLGSTARAMTDETSLALMPFGGGSTVLRRLGWGAVMGAAGEAAVLPREYRVAEELGLADPNPVSRIALGAGFGAAFEGAVIGIGRGAPWLWNKYQTRREGLAAATPDAVAGVEFEAGVDAAEARMLGDETVQEALAAGQTTDPNALSSRRPESVVVDYDLSGKIRDKPVSEGFMGNLRGSVAPLGDDIGVVISSGGQDRAGTPGGKRTGSHRHDVDDTGHSHTADVVLTRNGKPVTPTEDPELYARFLYFAGQRFPGIGHYDWGVHVGGGSVAAWGPDTSSRTLDPEFGAAISAGRESDTGWAGYGAATDDDVIARAIFGAESSGNVTARNPNSSAAGLGQILDGTWMDLVRKHRPELLKGRTANEVLAMRDDGSLNAEMTKAYIRDNRAELKAAGLPTGPTEIYLAHFLGPTGAKRALNASPSAKVSTVMTRKQIADNAGIRYNGKKFADFTVYDLRMWSRGKMASAYGGRSGTGADVPSGGSTSRGYTGQGQVAAGDGFRIDVEYQVVDAASLLRASGDLQPRDRSRMSSDAWIADTAARLDPAQLMPSPTADRGTPIVGSDNVIESGNGRFGAISRVYERHPDRAAAYRGAIEAAGFAIPEGIAEPVLIARRKTELSAEERARFAIEAQDSGVAVMTPTEIARAQSRSMTSPVLAQLDPSAPLKAEGNAGFVRAAMQALPRSSRNAMFDANGMLNNLGERQLREALFARAWPDPDILARFTETDAGELKSLMEALERAAPSWAALKADIEAGLVNPEMDISGFVLDAMRLIGAARDLSKREGLPIARAVQDLIEDVDLIEGAISPLTAAMVRKFWKNGRAASADEVAGFLTRYADDARKAGAAGGMFDAPGPRDVLRAIDDKTFGDLPEDLGQTRGFAQPGDQASPSVPAREEGFDAGAQSPEAEAVDAEIRADLDPEPLPDPTDPVSREQMETARADLGDDFADFELELGDGTSVRVRDVLDDLDADRAADEALNTCLINPAATFTKGDGA